MKSTEAEVERETTTLDQLADLSVSSRPLRVILLGEFSAGKSSLVNLLIGSDLLPTGVLATTRRLTELRYAERIAVAAVDEAGQRREIDPTLAAQSDVVGGRFDIGLPCERLRGVVLIDTSGFADPNRDPTDTLEAAKQSDVAIWCTRAHQAWRHSERMIWSSLPQHLQETGLLVATRGDKLDKASDRRSLMTRLRQDAGEMFQGVVLLSIPDAIYAQGKQPEELDVALWKRSGGEALAIELLQSLSRAVKRVMPREPARSDGSAGGQSATGGAPTEPEAQATTVAEPGEDGNEVVVDLNVADGNRDLAQPDDDDLAAKSQSEVDRFLGDLLATIDGCRLAACIDLDQSQCIASKSKVSPPSSAIGADLASLATSLINGEVSQPIRDVSRHFQNGDPPRAAGAIEAITIDRRHASYIFLRRADEPSQVIVLAIKGQSSVVASLGIVQLKMRQQAAG